MRIGRECLLGILVAPGFRRDATERDKFGRLLNLIEDRTGHWLAMQVEVAKIALSDTGHYDLDLDRLQPPATIPIPREAFDNAIARQVGAIATTVSGVLRDAGLAADAVDTVFFTGGSSGVPALRERAEDLPLICERVLERIAQDAGVWPPPKLGADALDHLMRYPFPGNVRELENLLHRAVALSGGDWIERADLGLPDLAFSDSAGQDLDAHDAARIPGGTGQGGASSRASAQAAENTRKRQALVRR